MDCSTDRLGSRQGQAWNIARHICITHKICTRYEFIYYTAHTSGDCISLRRRLRVASAAIGFIFYRLNSYRASRRRALQIAECAAGMFVSPLKYDIVVRVQRDSFSLSPLLAISLSDMQMPCVFFPLLCSLFLSNVCPHFCRQHDVCVTSTKTLNTYTTHTHSLLLQTKERLRHTHTHTMQIYMA